MYKYNASNYSSTQLLYKCIWLDDFCRFKNEIGRQEDNTKYTIQSNEQFACVCRTFTYDCVCMCVTVVNLTYFQIEPIVMIVCICEWNIWAMWQLQLQLSMYISFCPFNHILPVQFTTITSIMYHNEWMCSYVFHFISFFF